MFCCSCVFILMIRRPPRTTRTDTLFPYTTLCRSLALAGLELVELVAAGLVLHRPVHAAPVVIGGGMQGEIGIGQMRPGQRAEIGAARGDDGVDLEIGRAHV